MSDCFDHAADACDSEISAYEHGESRQRAFPGYKKPSNLDEWRTFQEWSNDGYWVAKGSKATWFDGVPKFSGRQVSMRFNRSRAAVWDNWSDDNEEPDEDAWFDPLDWGDK